LRQPRVALLLVLGEPRRQVQLAVQLLDPRDRGLVLLAVVGLQDRPLLRRDQLQRGVDEPRAVPLVQTQMVPQPPSDSAAATRRWLVTRGLPLVVLNVRADLADDGGVAKAVQVVVLDLEVLAHVQQDLLGLLEQRRV